MMPAWCWSGVMLQSDRFCRFLRTSVRRRMTCDSYFEGMPYAVSSITRPGSRLVGGIGNGAARAAVPAPSAPPVSAAVLRRKFLRLRTTESRSGLFDMGLLPCDELSMRESLRGSNKPSSFHFDLRGPVRVSVRNIVRRLRREG